MKKLIIKYIVLLILLFFPGTNVFAAGLTYHYDDLNRLVRAEYEDGSYVAYDYDDTGNRTSRILSASSTIIPGDTDSDGDVDLRDVILDLKISAGVDPVVYVEVQSDVNEDGRIGIEEAVYGLQTASGL